MPVLQHSTRAAADFLAATTSARSRIATAALAQEPISVDTHVCVQDPCGYCQVQKGLPVKQTDQRALLSPARREQLDRMIGSLATMSEGRLSAVEGYLSVLCATPDPHAIAAPVIAVPVALSKRPTLIFSSKRDLC